MQAIWLSTSVHIVQAYVPSATRLSTLGHLVQTSVNEAIQLLQILNFVCGWPMFNARN